jgi:MFS family permease
MTNKTWPLVVSLGITQTLAWASTYYLPAILAKPIAESLGIESSVVFLAFSTALVVSAIFGPWSGKAIDLLGGEKILSVSNIVFAVGLILLGFAQDQLGLWLAWLVIGFGMSGGLYESAFSTIVQIYGKDSRSAITGITLFAGFASTIGWPFSNWLLNHWGWRETCWTWAGIHLLMGLPLNASIKLLVTKTLTNKNQEVTSEAQANETPQIILNEERKQSSKKQVALLAFVFSATWFTSTAMAAHWPRMLEVNGVDIKSAIAIGALIGPSQVMARLFEFGFLRKVHPLLSAKLATLAHPFGVLLMVFLGPVVAPLFALFHGAGNGVLTISKGTLPLIFFGEKGYGYRQGWIMFPAKICSALAPWLFGLCISIWGQWSMLLTFLLGLLSALALFCIE